MTPVFAAKAGFASPDLALKLGGAEAYYRGEMDRRDSTRRVMLIAALLGIVTLAAYWPALHCAFLRLDDNVYVTDNPHVSTGLTLANVKWALVTGEGSNWHPLTWISHMLDVELFGMNALGMHLVNVLFHVANTVLLFWVLLCLVQSGDQGSRPGTKFGTTAPVWCSALVAALFGLHPLHVESVAWIAERKDVLSTLFFLLTLWAYARYVYERQRPQPTRLTTSAGKATHGLKLLPAEHTSHIKPAPWWYGAALIFYALGLLCKPMLVTTPFVLLLLDFWPLNRMNLSAQEANAAASPPQAQRFKQVLLKLVREKIPFLALTCLSCVATLEAQAYGHAMTPGLSFSLRMANAVSSYLKYLGMTVWPARLAIIYPHPNINYFQGHGGPNPDQWPAWQIVVAASVLALVSLLAVLWRERRPWFLVGWFWFLGTLVPVIGLVQVGLQALADRYTYIPLIGIFILFAWSAAQFQFASPDWGGAFRSQARRFCYAGALVLVTTCFILTRRQLAYWKDSFTIFSHALAVTRNNVLAECNVGLDYGERGLYGEALAYYRRALQTDPESAIAHFGIAHTYLLLNQPQKAIAEVKLGLRYQPWNAKIHIFLGKMLWDRGDKDEALTHYLAAMQLAPEAAAPHYNAGVALAQEGDYKIALMQLSQAVKLQPEYPEAVSQLADTYARLGRQEEARRWYLEAVRQFLEVVRRSPNDPQARDNLGGIWYRLGRPDNAELQYRAAVRLQPENPVWSLNLGLALARQGEFAKAAECFAQAVRLKPDYEEALNQEGCALAAASNFDASVKVFEQLARLTPTNATPQLNLGNALLLAGRTNEASLCFSNALELATRAGQTNLMQAAESHLESSRKSPAPRL